MLPPPCHLSPEKGRLNSTAGRAYPLPRLIVFDGDEGQRKGAIVGLLGLLDVENSARYRKGDGSTHCDLYACDFLHQLGAYLPIVWWNAEALAAWERGVPQSVNYPSKTQDGTVRELSANSLHDWLLERGPGYGWRTLDSAKALQSHVDQTGYPAVICARRADRRKSGHITCVVPDQFRADGAGIGPHIHGPGYAPLQTQAGSTNRRLFASVWWDSGQFDSVVFAAYHGSDNGQS